MERVHLSKRARRRTLAYFLVIHSIACLDNAPRRAGQPADSGILWSRTYPPVPGSSFQHRYLRVCIYVKVTRPRVRQRYFSIGDR